MKLSTADIIESLVVEEMERVVVDMQNISSDDSDDTATVADGGRSDDAQVLQDTLADAIEVNHEGVNVIIPAQAIKTTRSLHLCGYKKTAGVERNDLYEGRNIGYTKNIENPVRLDAWRTRWAVARGKLSGRIAIWSDTLSPENCEPSAR